MRDYRITLSVPSGFITPWHADTVFGHLCWVAERHGGFKTFSGAAGLIEPYRTGKPPLILSDGFPAGYLPAPANLRTLFEKGNSTSLDSAGYTKLKTLKKLEFLTLEQFAQYRLGQTFDFADKIDKRQISAVTLHNSINRITNTTGDGGSLFELEERFVSGGMLDIYARCEIGFKDDLCCLFDLFALGGFGKKRSSGKGAFSVTAIEPFDGFSITNDAANGFISISHFIPAAGDPTQGAYRTMVKYGKMGEEKAFGGNPFKKPLLMLKPGAVFQTGSVKPYYGRLVENIAAGDPNVVQYGYAFAVPLFLPA